MDVSKSYDFLELSPSLPNLEEKKKYFTIIVDGEIQSAIFFYLSKKIAEKECTDFKLHNAFSECIINSYSYETNYDDDDPPGAGTPDELLCGTKINIDYMLEIGRVKFNFLDGEIIIDRQCNNTVIGTRDSAKILKITKLHSDIGLNHISDFFKMCIEQRIRKNSSSSIRVRTFDETSCDWSCGHNISKRGLESIYIPEKDLNGIIEDMNNFLKNKDEYKRLGIPHRRNYLLYGPPGTGKTSTITALASYFNLGISTIVLGPTITDTNIIYAVSYTRGRNIIVMEDIDSIIHAAGQRELQNTKLTFSTLLNVLDGHIRREGSIVFMTTNFREKVKGVLDRPGRVDYQLEFKKMRLPQIKKMVRNFFNKIKEEEVIEISNLINSLKSTSSTASLQKFLFYIIQKKNGISILKSVEENLNILNEIISTEIERDNIDKGSALVM